MYKILVIIRNSNKVIIVTTSDCTFREQAPVYFKRINQHSPIINQYRYAKLLSTGWGRTKYRNEFGFILQLLGKVCAGEELVICRRSAHVSRSNWYLDALCDFCIDKRHNLKQMHRHLVTFKCQTNNNTLSAEQ